MSEQEKDSADCSDTVPLTDWIKADTKNCRPCVLPILAMWYMSELSEKGHPEESQRIQKVADKLDVQPKDLAAELDSVKAVEKLSPELRARLKEFDCAIQHNE